MSDAELDEEDQDEPETEPLHPEEWISKHQEELLNMWMSLREYKETYETNLLNYASFNSFCHWVHQNSI
jgi:hypothetical protein